MPKDVQWQSKIMHTGIWKEPVEGPVMVYQTESYDYWKSLLGRDDLLPGHFGENFTINGMADSEVCIGDRYRIGEAEFEVTQPRVTCFRVGMRLGEPDMPNLL